jgi:hypothetical protein
MARLIMQRLQHGYVEQLPIVVDGAAHLPGRIQTEQIGCDARRREKRGALADRGDQRSKIIESRQYAHMQHWQRNAEQITEMTAAAVAGAHVLKQHDPHQSRGYLQFRAKTLSALEVW